MVKVLVLVMCWLCVPTLTNTNTVTTSSQATLQALLKQMMVQASPPEIGGEKRHCRCSMRKAAKLL